MGQADWAGQTGEPQARECDHASTTSTETAGLMRVVCDTCGRVSLRYVRDIVQIHPHDRDLVIDLSESESPVGVEGLRLCRVCGEEALFMIPGGVACPTHAWAAVVRQEILGEEVWIPIRIAR